MPKINIAAYIYFWPYVKKNWGKKDQNSRNVMMVSEKQNLELP